MSPSATDALRLRIRTALPDAMRAKDAPTVSALRSMLSTIDNAEAVDTGSVTLGEASDEIAGAVVGLGAGDVARRVLTPDELAALVRGEIDERHAAASQYEAAGHAERAARLRAEAEALAPFAA